MVPKKILCCTDFSDNSEPAIRLALDYANAFGASVIIAHIINSFAGCPAYTEGIPVEAQSIIRDLEKTAKDRLDVMAKELSAKTNTVGTYSTVGIPAEEIVREAREESADLIVMGTHGWTGLRHILLGSVAERVLRGASCPVLVVRSDAAA